MKYRILLHAADDDVGVAVADLQSGEEAGAATLEGEAAGMVRLVEAVPLGHKVALRDIPAEGHVREYGRAIGRATQSIRKGAHVHVHNLHTLRW